MRRTLAFSAILTSAVVAGALATNAVARPAVSALDEPAVVAIFDLANTADIETGSLAAKRAANREVRDYGTMLARVHTEVRQKGRDLAKRLGVTAATLPADDPMAKNHAAVIAKLSGLRGAEFDRAFLQHEADFHAAVLSAVKTSLLPAIKNQELKDFVASLAPAFEAHRVMADHLAKKTGSK